MRGCVLAPVSRHTARSRQGTRIYVTPARQPQRGRRRMKVLLVVFNAA